MKVITPINKSDELKNAIFLAGPSPRCGKEYVNDCQWRKEAIQMFKAKGFNGDIIDPVNRNFDRTDLITQIKWQREYMYKASLIFFWIPRSEEHPAYTTNVQFGNWLGSKSIVLGFPKDSIKNDYLQIRYNIDNQKSVFNSLEEMVDWSIEYLQNRKTNYFFTADTHFSQQRTLKLSARPFNNVDDMDLQLISNWNKKITMNDVVFHLGDFGNYEIVKLLNFKTMYFIPGNYEQHNGQKFASVDSRIQVLNQVVNPFDGETEYPCFVDEENQQNYYLVHEPINPLFNENSEINENAFYLYGHIHRMQMVKRNGINVGVDGHRFEPLSLQEVQFLRGGIENHFDENVYTDCVMY